MKKILCAALVMCMIPFFAFAEDLSVLSYDELVALSKKITAEIMSRPEWKAIDVPPGDWTIGADIPAGTYSLSCVDEYGASVTVFKDGKEIDFRTATQKMPIGKYTFDDGMSISLNRTMRFAPPVSLGF